MKFSIIMPTWNRASILPKTINSILNQTYPEFELLIMDDGSTDNTQEILQDYAKKDSRIKIFKHEIPQERVICRSELMAQATGDWIYWVDSDDEIIYGTLEILKHNIEINKKKACLMQWTELDLQTYNEEFRQSEPEYKVFNFGQIIFSLLGTTIKIANNLPEIDGEGMDHFDTGRVGTGGFVFSRDCLQSIQELPKINNVFDLADWFGERVKDWWKEKNRDMSMVPLYNRDDRWCGNPWGDDYVFVWLLTRKYKSKKLPINPYMAYIRTENWAYEFSDGSGTMGGSSKGVPK